MSSNSIRSFYFSFLLQISYKVVLKLSADLAVLAPRLKKKGEMVSFLGLFSRDYFIFKFSGKFLAAVPLNQFLINETLKNKYKHKYAS